MKVFIPTHNRADRITTPWAWPGMDYCVVCHTDQARDAYLWRQPLLDPERVLVSAVPADETGLVRQRAWIAARFGRPGEWLFFADDNIRRFTGIAADVGASGAGSDVDTLPTQHPAAATAYGVASWGALFGRVLDATDMTRVVGLMQWRAEAMGVWLCGFATTDNPYFRGKHWRTVGYVSGKAMLWRHDPDYPWSEIVHMEDFHHSAEHHRRHGRVLVNNWVAPDARHYEPGGMGVYAARIPQRRASVVALLARYPGLLRAKDRPGFEPGTELGFRLTTGPQVDRWRSHLNAGQP